MIGTSENMKFMNPESSTINGKNRDMRRKNESKKFGTKVCTF